MQVLLWTMHLLGFFFVCKKYIERDFFRDEYNPDSDIDFVSDTLLDVNGYLCLNC